MAVRMTAISKRFGDLKALRDVGLEVRQGSVHAIVGENGAGKTTLMRILCGGLRADAGRVEVEGEPAAFATPSDSFKRGVGMVSQHYAIIPELSCIDNLILGFEGEWVLNRREAIERAERLARSLGLSFDWHSLAERLTPAGKQKLEVLKLLWRDARIMILDEPTAMLSPSDADALFVSLRQLSRSGKTILLVTHRLSEVIEHCDEATVLRQGEAVATLDPRTATAQTLAELIVGGRDAEPALSTPSTGKVCLEATNLVVRGARSEYAVKSASFKLKSGEILGVAGVDGNGQAELFEALLGVRPVADGKLALFEEEITRLSTAARLARGIAAVPEDRHLQGVIDDWRLEENAMLGHQRSLCGSPPFTISHAALESLARSTIELFDTKSSGPMSTMRSLSGGNQQRFVLGRALQGSTRVLLAFQPTRGLDIRATRVFYSELRRRCEAGMAVFVIGFDLDELIDHCDRIIVMYAGKIFEPPVNGSRDRSVLGKLMVGLTDD